MTFVIFSFFHYTICAICGRIKLTGMRMFLVEITKKEENIGCKKQ